MKWAFRTLALAAISWGAVEIRLSAQIPQDQSARLDTSVELNKQEFLAGEEIEITVKLRNATAVALTAPAPFHPEVCGGVYLVPWDTALQAPSPSRPVSEIAGGCDITERTPFETFPPGSERTVRWRTSDLYSRRPVWAGPMVVPEQPGQYAIVWKYTGDFARFRILGGGTMEAGAEGRHPMEVVRQPDPGSAYQGEQYPVYRRAFSIRRDSISHLVVPFGLAKGLSTYFSHTSVTGPYNAHRVSACATFRVVATSTAPITEIQVSVDGQDNTTIVYRDAGGTQRRLDLDPDYNPR